METVFGDSIGTRRIIADSHHRCDICGNGLTPKTEIHLFYQFAHQFPSGVVSVRKTEVTLKPKVDTFCKYLKIKTRSGSCCDAFEEQT